LSRSPLSFRAWNPASLLRMADGGIADGFSDRVSEKKGNSRRVISAIEISSSSRARGLDILPRSALRAG